MHAPARMFKRARNFGLIEVSFATQGAAAPSTALRSPSPVNGGGL
jgi:hypothetical protein